MRKHDAAGNCAHCGCILFPSNLPRPNKRKAPATEALIYGCMDCAFQFEERPSYCGTCKVDGGKLSCIKATSLTLKGYTPRPHKGRVKKVLTLEEEHSAFEAYRRKRNKKHGKKPGNYKFGKGLATNMAAPMIAKLRAKAQREAAAEVWR